MKDRMTLMTRCWRAIDGGRCTKTIGHHGRCEGDACRRGVVETPRKRLFWNTETDRVDGVDVVVETFSASLNGDTWDTIAYVTIIVVAALLGGLAGYVVGASGT